MIRIVLYAWFFQASEKEPGKFVGEQGGLGLKARGATRYSSRHHLR